MAAIDFPASPVNGQVFPAANGAVYQWNGTMWLQVGSAQVNGPALTVFAVATGGIPSAAAKVSFAAPIVNLGGYWDATNNRWTPPAGTYLISGQVACAGLVNSPTIFTMLYKNGARYAQGYTTGSVSQILAIAPNFAVVVQANGTDYFELWTYNNSAGNQPLDITATFLTAIGMTQPQAGGGSGGGPILQDLKSNIPGTPIITGNYPSGTGAAPLITGGAAVASRTFIPKSSTSTIEVEIILRGYLTTTDAFVMALFNGSTLIDMQSHYQSGGIQSMMPQYFKTSFPSPGVGVSTTLNFRFGGNSGSGLYLNQTFNGSAAVAQVGVQSWFNIREIDQPGMVAPSIVPAWQKLMADIVVSGAAVPTIDITGIPSTVQAIMLVGFLMPTATADLWVRFSQAGAFRAGASDYQFGEVFGNATGAGGVGQAAGAFVDHITISGTIAATATIGGISLINTLISNIQAPVGSARFGYGGGLINGANNYPMAVSAFGFANFTGAIDGIRLLFSTGNIAVGSRVSVFYI